MRQFHFHVSGEDRKVLVRTVSDILGEDAAYMGAPSFAYRVDGYLIDRSGMMTCPENASREDINYLLAALREHGYRPEMIGNDYDAFSVEISRAEFPEEASSNLLKIIDSKAALLKKALETSTLTVEATSDKLIFPWFTLHDLDGEADAYTRLVSAICKMAKEQKRVTARPRDTPNEKFAMRLFLIRLGFIGDEYKSARKILLRNLSGNSSWKAGHPPEHAATASAAYVDETQRGVPHAK